jgi:hypothetical protein
VLEEDLEDFDTDTAVIGEEADQWDEETLGLDWSDADAQTVVDEFIPSRGFGD